MIGFQESKNTDGRERFGSHHSRAIADLLAIQGPPERFLAELLATQCHLAKAEAAVILRSGDSNQVEVLATYPTPAHNGTAQRWLSKLEKPFHKVLASGQTLIVRQGSASNGDGKPKPHLIVIPIMHQGAVRAAAAFRIRTHRHQRLLLSHSRLETTPLLVDHHELQLTLNMHLESLHRLQCVFEVLDRVNRSTRFLKAAMALCNEIAARLSCSRVSLGMLSGRCVRVQAMSHADTFSRQMQVVQMIEAAMEECLDQDLEVAYPAADTAMVASRAAAKLCACQEPSAVLSLPIRQAGEAVAVVTLERLVEQPFDRLAEIETARLISDLCAPRLLDLYRSDRWFGARLASEFRRHLGMLLGHEHTWAKLSAVVVFSMVVWMTTMQGDYRIDAGFTFKAQHQQVVVAPFDTFSKSVLVEPGDRVEAGKTMLGTLETAERRLKLAALKAEQLGYQKQMTASMRDQKTAEAQIATAQSDKLAAQIRLIETQIEQATLVAPISGWVISEDQKQQIGAPVDAGKILFEIASVDSLRAELHVPESSIAIVTAGQTGELASVGHPDQKVTFVIERINPIAEVVNHQNVFRVRARISEHLDWMRPGMQGKARIDGGKKTYLWIVSHRLVNWLRMKLWI